MRTLLLFCLLLTGAAHAQHATIFPQPNSIVEQPQERYELLDTIRYHGLPEVTEAITALQERFFRLHTVRFQAVPQTAAAELECTQTHRLPVESYKLEITKKGIQIDYGSKKGLLYALQSLDQLMGAQRGTIVLKGTTITDSPRFGYRGVHLDCARHFFTVSELKGFLDEIAALKFNTFHWHLTDDQGWRLEIKQYPKLTTVGAWRDSTIVGHYSRTPRTYERQHYGGFYTQEEAKEIVRYAGQLGITVIPEIELPGHARAALAAYPELGCTGEALPVPGLWGVFDEIFCSKPETITFLKNVLAEVIAIFPSETIHIGGDEAPKVLWDACPRCKQVREKHGLHDSHELQSYVIREMETFLRAKGRKLMGWDEILEGGLAENAQVMSWRGTEGGIAAARAKHPVVMTPTSYCYFDYYQSGHPDEPLAIGGFLPLEKVYRFEPVPAELTAAESAYILGGQANTWTEYLPEMKDVYYMLFPRLVAMAEVLWTNERPTYEAFVEALTQDYLPRLTRTGIPYSTAFLDPKITPAAGKNHIEYTIAAPLPAVTFTMNNAPTSSFRLQQTNEQHELNMTVVANYEGKPLRSAAYHFTAHSLVGKPVVFTRPPNAKFDHNGALALTDGVRGQRPWKGDQWLGFTQDTVQFSIDLGAKTKFETITLGTLNDPGSWIYSPKRIRVETSTDGRQFKSFAEQAITAETITVNSKGKARFLRITLINDAAIPAGNPGAGTTPWTFIDELMVH